MSDTSAIVVIPAREGSKRIPNKNRREFLGVPIVRRVVQIVGEVARVARVVVSTDDKALASIVSDLCEVIDRPAELADDHTPTWPVVVHAIRRLGLVGAPSQIVCCVYPTAVLLRADTLVTALDSTQEQVGNYVFPVVRYGFPPQRAVMLNPSGRTSMLEPENYFTRSQDLAPVFHDAAQFYVAHVATWMTKDRFFDEGIPVVISELEAQDIDNEDDWKLAELKFRMLHGSN